MSAIVPTGLAALAARPGGGRQIADAVANQPLDIRSLVGSLAAPAKLADAGNGRTRRPCFYLRLSTN